MKILSNKIGMYPSSNLFCCYQHFRASKQKTIVRKRRRAKASTFVLQKTIEEQCEEELSKILKITLSA
jgi:hypothetical protein